MLFFKLKQSTADAAADLSTASPAVRLLHEYIHEAPKFTGDDPGFRGRCVVLNSNSGTSFCDHPLTGVPYLRLGPRRAKLLLKTDKGLPREC